MGLTLVTTTKDRPVCFALLEKWIARQTLQPDQWLVVNDGEPYEYGKQQVISRKHTTGNSLCKNWLEALRWIEHERIAVAEDDDWYHPEYLATVSAALERAELVGIQGDFYWHMPSRSFRRLHNVSDATLAASAFKKGLGAVISKIARHGSIWLDGALWEWQGKKELIRNQASDSRALHVGFKGMPGAAGLGLGHSLGSTDHAFSMLRKWIGQDVEVYRALYEHERNSNRRYN